MEGLVDSIFNNWLGIDNEDIYDIDFNHAKHLLMQGEQFWRSIKAGGL